MKVTVAFVAGMITTFVVARITTKHYVKSGSLVVAWVEKDASSLGPPAHCENCDQVIQLCRC